MLPAKKITFQKMLKILKRDNDFVDLCHKPYSIINPEKIYKTILQILQGKYNFILNIDNIVDVLYNITKDSGYLENRLLELKPLADSLKYKKKIVIA